MDETGLATAAAAGDQAAFRELWNRAERPAYALCVRLTGNRADALDALADAQLAAWRHLDRFQGTSSFATWVYVIARNAALALIRARRPQAGLAVVEDRADPAATFADPLVESMAVQEALAQLPERHREAVLLWAGGLSYAQVGELMGAPTSSVRVWIHRGRARLRALLDPLPAGHGDTAQRKTTTSGGRSTRPRSV